MKFLHTADWHIGLKAAGLGGACARVRGERLAAARRVIEAANERGAEFIIIAGDMFDDNGVAASTVKDVVSILDTSNAPVYVIPGNHDFLCPGSVWEREEWGRSGKIRLLLEERPVEVDGGVLFPCPIRDRKSVDDPTAWVPLCGDSGDNGDNNNCNNGDDGRIRIVVAHGSVEGLPTDALDFPIPRNLPEMKGLDYAALGHWHSYASYDTGGVCRMLYTGSHSTTRFGKADSGSAAFVTIEDRGSPPAIEKITTGGLTWIDRRVEIDGGGSIKTVIDDILALDNQDLTLVRIELSGIYGIDDIGVLDELRAIGESGRFLYYDAVTDGLRPTAGGVHADTGWLGDIEEAVVRRAGKRIAGMLDGAAGEERAVLERALLELYMMSEGARK